MIIEPYRFLEPLGRGSFGEVWRVEACTGPLIGQLFAAKISYLPAEHEHITREMGETIRIMTERHRYILKLFSGEGCFDGRLLLVMELAEGSLLDRSRQYRASGAPFPVRELVLYVRQAAEALDYVHERDLVHGGINPGDILLLNGQARIADPTPVDQAFARIQAANLSKALCMAPERRRGDKHFQSDQYALAATYAWLRIGEPALGLETHVQDMRTISHLLRPEQNVLERALCPEPDNRYRSCLEFAEALNRAVI
jgi:serine/threonine protein kinase